MISMQYVEAALSGHAMYSTYHITVKQLPPEGVHQV